MFSDSANPPAVPSSGSPLHPSVQAEVEDSPSVQAAVDNSQKDGQPMSQQKRADRKRKGSLSAKRNLQREHKMGNLNDAAFE